MIWLWTKCHLPRPLPSHQSVITGSLYFSQSWNFTEQPTEHEMNTHTGLWGQLLELLSSGGIIFSNGTLAHCCVILNLTCVALCSAYTWWRHQMETFSVLLALCEGNSPIISEFPSQRPMSFDVFFDLHLNKCLSNQSRCRWFEMPSHPLWHHCNDNTLRLIENVWCFADNIFKLILLDEYCSFWFNSHWILFLRIQLTVGHH